MIFKFKYAVVAVLAAVIMVGGFYSWKFISESNQPVVAPKNYKIGLLLTDKDIGSANIAGFKAGMEKAGYKEGVNVTYIEKNAGADRATIIDGYAKDLNDAGLDLIIISSTSAGKALQKLQDAGKLQTKIFFLAVGSPHDLVKNLQLPEGFITGIGEGTVEFAGKRLEFLKELVPNMRKVISVVEKGSTNEKLFKE
ncbi:MAG: ABC transporter substrate binding protein, partial [Candidatus Giovannonibacteria bacterium GW2011_GWA2_44_13b]